MVIVMKNIIKITLRTIKGSLGRFIAIFAIIALGVGFFSGLRICRDAMVNTGDKFLKDHSLFDIRLISTYGFTNDEIKSIYELRNVESAEGAFSTDIVYKSGDNSESVLKLHSITDTLNTLELVKGRFPENNDECVVDARKFDSSFIGRKIILTESNSNSVLDSLSCNEFKVVGIVNSPLYISFERGSSTVGNGKVDGFMFVSKDAFTSSIYTEMYIKLKNDYKIYDEEYKDFIEDFEYTVKPVCTNLLEERFNLLKSDAQQKINEGLVEYEAGLEEYNKSEILAKTQIALLWASVELTEKTYTTALDTVEYLEELLEKAHNTDLTTKEQYDELSKKLAEAKFELDIKLDNFEKESVKYQEQKNRIESELKNGKKTLDEAKIQLDEAQNEVDSMLNPELYILSRSTNIGYVSFENDTAIVLGISTVFPVFFFLVAALVCNTTMSRMVNEERGQIGTLKALGFETREIKLIYVLYAGSSAILGCIFGFFLGSYAIPTIIWEVYKILYGFAPLEILMSIPLLLVSLFVSVICSVGVTLISCSRMLKETPASLIRPKDLLGGNRSLLEKIPVLNKCFGFFDKISIRNTFKYKSRLIMMILGIAGCTALLITGFGIDDSISGIVDEQFDTIMSYDYMLTLKNPIDDNEAKEFEDNASFEVKNMLFVYEEALTLEKDGTSKQINLNVPSSDEISDFIYLKDGKRKIDLPQKGEAVITKAIAEAFSIKIGDTVSLTNSSMKRFNFTVADICDNHVSNYIYVSKATYMAQNGGECLYNRICANIKEGSDLHSVAAESASHENVMSLGINADTRRSLDDMLSCLNLIVYLVCICAGALAFIVIYNLTNLNISERIREIATLKVLGFKKSESALYVFRETAIQSIGGIVVGIPLGILLHAFVMSQIKIDFVSFETIIHTSSFVISSVLTIVFLIFVDTILYGKIKKINAAEALKSVE